MILVEKTRAVDRWPIFMFDVGVLGADHLLALLGQAPSEFDVFAVHEKRFIEEAVTVGEVAAKQQAAAGEIMKAKTDAVGGQQSEVSMIPDAILALRFTRQDSRRYQGDILVLADARDQFRHQCRTGDGVIIDQQIVVEARPGAIAVT